mmetsp:Transcript_13098/g.38522  ORF Transcript_13098/g.38522 Transcript_13098/m.38522 type:complete len:239 (-) Transcript_13098:654-1370(-)
MSSFSGISCGRTIGRFSDTASCARSSASSALSVSALFAESVQPERECSFDIWLPVLVLGFDSTRGELAAVVLLAFFAGGSEVSALSCPALRRFEAFETSTCDPFSTGGISGNLLSMLQDKFCSELLFFPFTLLLLEKEESFCGVHSRKFCFSSLPLLVVLRFFISVKLPNAFESLGGGALTLSGASLSVIVRFSPIRCIEAIPVFVSVAFREPEVVPPGMAPSCVLGIIGRRTAKHNG